MKVRFNLDRESGLRHIWDHGVSETEAIEALNNAIERRSGSHGSEGINMKKETLKSGRTPRPL